MMIEEDYADDIAVDINESKPLLSGYKVYKRRLYILIVFSFFAGLQGMIWNTWGPVSETASIVFGWDNTILALLPNWGTIFSVISFIPMVNLLLRFGVRFAIIHCCFLSTVGTGLRCIPGSNLLRTIMANVCAILNGYCGTFVMIAPPVISAVWFPPNERTTATAFSTIIGNNVAMAVSFLLPKLMVRDNSTTTRNASAALRVSEMKGDLENFLLVEFAGSVALLLLVALYFPKKPPTPPSSSATMERVEFKSGAATLMKSWQFWLILITYAIPYGVQNAFIGILDETLSPHGISQDESNRIGLYSTLVGIPGGMIFSRISDWKKKLMKRLIILALLISGLSYGFFSLACAGIVPPDRKNIYISLIVGGFFCNGGIPLIYEFSCEISYPVSEEVVTGVMTAGNSLFGFLLLALFMIKQLGTTWTTSVLSGTFLLSVPLLICLPARYLRSDVDVSVADARSNNNIRAINAAS